MVGFGSSLRMSRRRGWEDAYLDYASLRLLLTQIEAAYEEEDWKRRSAEEEIGNDDREDDRIEDTVGRLRHMLTVAWQRAHGHFTRNDADVGDSNPSPDTNKSAWVSNEYDYKNVDRRHKHEMDDNERALSKGGWRSHGTDFRDELFKISDEQLAYGLLEDDNDDEWEDIDDYDDGDEESYYETYTSGDLFSGEEQEDEEGGNFAQTIVNTDTDLEEKPSIGLNKISEAVTPVRVGVSSTQTPTSMSPMPNDEEASMSSKQKVRFSDSPGVLETGYETFASAAFKRGFVSPNGESQMKVGSPPDTGWMDFIPNLLARKDRQPPNQLLGSSETDALLPSNPSLSQSLTISPSCEAVDDPDQVIRNDQPNRYTHFADAFPSNRTGSSSKNDLPPRPPGERSPAPPLLEINTKQESTSLPPQEELKSQLEAPPFTPVENVEPRPYSQLMLKFDSPEPTPPSFLPPPEPPMTPPMTPVDEKMKEYDREKRDTRIGGFGVSLKMIPTESTELLHPSSPTKTPNSESIVNQFYSFQNSESNANTSRRDSKDFDEDRSGSNMIAFYSSNQRDGSHFTLRSPTKSTAKLPKQRNLSSFDDNLRHQVVPSSSTKPSDLDHDTTFGSFILGMLRGKVSEAAAPTVGVHPARLSRNTSGEHHIRLRGSRARRQKAIANQRKRAQLQRRRQARRRQRERVPPHLIEAHNRAAQVTERFRGLLRAEVEKVILFANSRLGELSDTIGSLRYSSFDGQDIKKYPALDGGLHLDSSSEDTSGVLSWASSSSDELEGDEIEKSAYVNKSDSDDPDEETKRQINLRDRLRISRPLFQKGDFLMGDDFSLLSAVDELDAYALIGIELMHLLKYLAINIIATRKICRKHDRLLSNRMLGGYYQRQAIESKKKDRKRRHPVDQWNDVRNDDGLVSNHTVGIYDFKIQHIANSTTMHTVSNSLSIALQDFEASQTRAELGLGGSREADVGAKSTVPTHVSSPRAPPKSAASRIRGAMPYQLVENCLSPVDDDESAASPPEYTNRTDSQALIRLQFVVNSIYALREAARFKQDDLESYCSRLFMVSTGQCPAQNVFTLSRPHLGFVGPNINSAGLEGCSMQTLDVLKAYNPDSPFTLRSDSMNRALNGSMPLVTSLSASTNEFASYKLRFNKHIASSMSIDPPESKENTAILQINAFFIILFIINYYTISPNIHQISVLLEEPRSGTALIGITNVGVIVNSMLHTFYLSKPKSLAKCHVRAATFRLPLMMCAGFGSVGNFLFAIALKSGDFTLALVGRLLTGFASAEVLNRKLVLLLLSQKSLNIEVVRLVKWSLIATSYSLLLGGLLSNKPLNPPAVPTPIIDRNLLTMNSVSYTMAAIWVLLLVALVVFDFDTPAISTHTMSENEVSRRISESGQQQEEDFNSDSEDEDIDTALRGDDVNTFASKPPIQSPAFRKLQALSRNMVKRAHETSYYESFIAFKGLLFAKIAFPMSIITLLLAQMTIEALLSSASSITSLYFGWSGGAKCGLLLGLVYGLTLPINTSLASDRLYTERSILKYALEMARLGFVVLLNYQSLASFFMSLVHGFKHEKDGRASASFVHTYDSWVGPAKYVMGNGIVFVSVSSLLSVTLTLMSKVAPGELRKYSTDCAFIVVLVSSCGRLLADMMLFAFDSVPQNETMNSMCFLMIAAYSIAVFFVRKHYFFLL